MQVKSIREIKEDYDLELDRIVKEIRKLKKNNAKILLQFPDGMKPYAATVVDELEKKVKNAEFIIWLGSCFGACDVPNLPEKLKFDLLIQFGHSEWK